jgi:hypothetical protein
LVLVLALVLVVPDSFSAGWCQKYCQNFWPFILLAELVGGGGGGGGGGGADMSSRWWECRWLLEIIFQINVGCVSIISI